MSEYEFTLRQYKHDDASSIAKYLNNKKVTDGLWHVPYPYPQHLAEEWIENTLRLKENEQPAKWIHAIAINNELIGTIGLSDIECGHKARLGYWIGESFWGRGIMTEAVKRFTTEMFDKFDLCRIWAMHYPHNPASGKVLLKAGFEHEGIMRKNILKNGKYLDTIIYAKVRD